MFLFRGRDKEWMNISHSVSTKMKPRRATERAYDGSLGAATLFKAGTSSLEVRIRSCEWNGI